MTKILACCTLLALSLSSMAKLPDPLWTPMGGHDQQQFGAPIRHITKRPQHRETGINQGPEAQRLLHSNTTTPATPALHEL